MVEQRHPLDPASDLGRSMDNPLRQSASLLLSPVNHTGIRQFGRTPNQLVSLSQSAQDLFSRHVVVSANDQTGQTIHDLGLACRAANEKAAIATVGGRGVKVKVNGVKKRPSDFDGIITIFNLDVRVAQNADVGPRDIQVNNPGAAKGPLGRGFLHIVE